MLDLMVIAERARLENQRVRVASARANELVSDDMPSDVRRRRSFDAARPGTRRSCVKDTSHRYLPLEWMSLP